ncbi:MAG: hypothetical protein GEU91_10000 [Rhizobiales bacterium]|nr:hypothetical protein [Hyphomicrobiales bacterium]
MLRKTRRSIGRVSVAGCVAASWLRATMRRRLVRRIAAAAAVLVTVVVVALVSLSWRLSRGPISLDLATPWLVEAIEDKLGGQQRVQVGGTQIERSEGGRTSLRLRDVVLRDGDGTVVASAPKVEVAISGAGLLTGHIRAERVSLVGAEVSVRVETDGKVTVFAGGDKRPIAIAVPKVPPAEVAAVPAAPGVSAVEPPGPGLLQTGADGFAAMLAWIDSLGRTGLDGRELTEIGLKSGTLIVEDQREGRRWTFDNIDVSLSRPQPGGVQFTIQSSQTGRHWSINASATPTKADRHRIRVEALRVPAKDLLLALRFAELPIKADLPLSVRLQTEIGPTGALELLQGSIIAETGMIGGNDAADGTIPVQHAAINFEWNASRRALLVPLQMALAGNRFTLLAQVDAPAKPGDPWRVQLGGGSMVLADGGRRTTPLVLNRVQVNARFDPAKRRIHLDRGELGNSETSIALSGGFDYSGSPRLMLGLAARRMSLATMKQLWPSFVSPNVRNWVMEHVSGATIERVDVAINAPMEVLGSVGPPIPDDALSIAVLTSGSVLRPLESLPEIRDADLNVRATGRTATVKLGHGTVTMPSGRKLTMSDGVFTVPDTHATPTMSHTQFRMEGTVAAAAELLAMERLRAASGSPLDPATSRGNINARVTLGIPLLKDISQAAISYALDVDFNNFAADRMIMGQRVEAASLRLSADNMGYRVKGDVKIAGAAASLEYRVRRGQTEDEIRLQGVLDDATRDRLGLDLAPALTGPVSIKLAGRIGANSKEGRFSVEADLTQARLDDLLPGLVKPPAKPARATFTLVTRPAMTRLEDLVFDGSGSIVRGSIVVDGSGNVVSANFPVFSLSSGDKMSLKTERGNSGAMLATLRGDVLDGRQFMKTIMAGRPSEDKGHKAKPTDLDLDAKVGAIAGHHGEALRGLELKLSRRDGRIRNFALKANIGRNATLIGSLRPRSSGRQGLHLETDDAGALFRFTDTYSRITGGRMTVTMDPPSSDPAPKQGILNIENFAVRGEATLDRIVAGAASGPGSGVEFTAMRVDFTRTPGHLSIRDGVVRGPVIGATIDGAIDYRRDEVRMRGTFVPLFGLNNMFGRLPIVGLFLGGGSNEGLVGITYEVVGPLSAPLLRVNPISAVAPGFIRKFFEFPSTTGPSRPPAAFDSTR